ncbi:hypothetical protein GZH53_14955 [Flavihumibacter sp. R14]|nr:hypothetical protein [Flavihumibacter soli]
MATHIKLILLVTPLLLQGYLGYCQDASTPVAPWFVERYKISAGVFIPISETNIRVSGNSGTIGTDLDLEDDLGFEKSTTTFVAELQWRAWRRSRFDLKYFFLNRDVSKTLDEEIIFGDETYPVNTEIDAFFETKIYRFSYGYAVLAKPRYELGLMIGTHVVETGTGLTVVGTNVGGTASSDFDFTAPLPDLGIWGGYAISDRVAVNGELGYLSLKVDETDGRITTYNIAVTYKPIEHLHLALAYTGLNFRVDVTRNTLEGHLKWGYNGPSFAATYAFGKRPWSTSKIKN